MQNRIQTGVMAYHAIVRSMRDYKVRIDCEGRYYQYDYATLVGMKESQINDTPAVLIFPDEVLK